jgi:hypothetical protein
MNSLALFCITYFSAIFYLTWSKDLRRIVAKIENVVLKHDKCAVAMPRGSGKTRLCQAALLWAILSGRHKFAMLIAAIALQGHDAIGWFKSALAENALLLEDFPEVCYPLRKLENEPRRCRGQRYQGAKTNIKWEKDKIVLPTIPGSKCSGSVIAATSLEGNIRGAWASLPDGRVVRPTLAICDDPQTTESARSQGPNGQTTYRLQTINQDVQGLAGPDQQTAMLIPCTVISQGDLADQLLNRKLYPDYHGERTKRLYAWPKNKALWEEYRALREAALQADASTEVADEFYRARRAACGKPLDVARDCSGCRRAKECMDCGAIVDWVERLDDPRNQSAVQAAMHSFYRYGPAGFAAEFQNEPLLSDEAARLPTAMQICAKANGYKRGVVPEKSRCVTAFIDLGDNYLAWLVAAWESNFTGAVIDYGTWPDQGKSFSKMSVKRSLQEAYSGRGPDGAILAGLKDLGNHLLSREFVPEYGPPMQVGLCLVDTGYKPDVVRAAIRLIGRLATLRASRGRGITAGKTQFDDYKRDRCREMGLHWWVPKEAQDAVIQIDTNFWKSFIHSRLATAQGDPGALTLFGKPDDHGLLAEHILSEYYTLPSTEKGVPVQEWHQHVGKDNELLDCLVGAAAAASCRGCSLLPVVPRARSRRHVKARVTARSFDPALG